ncbi:MAG: hypothetical protein WCG93_11660, partial [Paludibacter sp.]
MATSELRSRDMMVEREISKFLDEKLYSNSSIFSKTERTDNIENQLSGSDIIISIPKLGIINAIVDEKAATHYINKNLPTFAFELCFKLNNGKIVEGWLTDTGKKTQFYLLMWISAKKDWDIKKEDITQIEYILIERNKILSYLNSKGYGIFELKNKAKIILNNNIDGVIDKLSDTAYYFYFSNRLTEKPIN